jgi:hypothetical protein
LTLTIRIFFLKMSEYVFVWQRTEKKFPIEKLIGVVLYDPIPH